MRYNFKNRFFIKFCPIKLFKFLYLDVIFVVLSFVILEILYRDPVFLLVEQTFLSIISFYSRFMFTYGLNIQIQMRNKETLRSQNTDTLPQGDGGGVITSHQTVIPKCIYWEPIFLLPSGFPLSRE